MQNTDETKKRILNLLQAKGPSLPVQISKEVKMNTLFVSAFLSELKDENKIKISSLKVGGSPLYYLQGQESQLENFRKYLHPKEAEAFELLKKNRILKDSEQEPAIRVALRAIKDFAFSFKNDEEIYWRYLAVQEPEIIQIFNSKPFQKKEIKIEQEATNIQSSESSDSEITLSKPEIKKRKKTPKKQEQENQEQIELKPEIESNKISQIFQNPLAINPIERPKKEKPRSDFVAKIIVFLNKNNFRIVEEIDYKAKGYNCITEINSDLGKILFLTQAKDKKTTTDSELQALLSKSQSIPLPALVLYTGNRRKKAQEYEKKYYSILKTKKID